MNSLTTVRINPNPHLIHGTADPETIVWVKYLFGRKLEPLASEPTRVDAWFMDKFKAPGLTHLILSQAHDGLDAIIQQVFSSHHNLDISILPRPCQFRADGAKPARLFFEGLLPFYVQQPCAQVQADREVVRSVTLLSSTKRKR